MNRLLTRTQIEKEYGLPSKVMADLFRAIAPACSGDDGEELFLESVIDGWMTQRFAGTAPAQVVNADEFLTTKEVATMLGCSYCEARDRLLDGRIRAIKDGRWLRTRRAWVEDYIAGKTVEKPDLAYQDLSIPVPPRRKVGTLKFKAGGAGHRFLQKLAERDEADKARKKGTSSK